MKLPYTPLQSAVRHVEEDRELPATLAGMAVVCCSVHSQVAPVCAGIGGDVRVAYLQLAGGALPVSLSDAVRALQARGLIAAAVAVGACIEGVAAAEAANAASALGGSPIVAVRASEADARARHRGVSHHTGVVLALCLGDVSVAWPANRPVPDLFVAEPREI